MIYAITTMRFRDSSLTPSLAANVSEGTMRSEERWGVLAAAASSLLGGSSVAVTRAVIGEMSPASLGLFRFGIGALCLLPLFLAARQRGPGRRDLVAIVLLGLLFFAVFP